MSKRVQPEDAGPASPATGVPALADGTELIGEFEGSGYREPPQLVYRADGQMVHLPSLLYLVVKILDEYRQRTTGRHRATGRQATRSRTVEPENGDQVLARVADEVSREAGRQFTPDHIAYLLDRKLAPLGVTTYSDGSPPTIAKANPFLALRFRVAVLPQSITWILGGLFAWLFRPVAMVPVLAAVLASEAWLFGTQHLGNALHQTIVMPASILMIVVLAVASAAFHEIGHATACRYSGVRPGAMGCGIYLVWPAFYTDITDSYRLNRAGRIRTDLGGVYFNGLFIIGLTLLYLWTGFAPLLVAILSVNIEIIQQLLPTLRFDGYYIMSDLVGIPDLFKYIGPILKRSLLRQPQDERLQVLKRWPQIVVTLWVLIVLPALAIQLGVVIVQFPNLLRTAWQMITQLVHSAVESNTPVLTGITSGLQILLLLLPAAGITLVVLQLVRWAVRVTHRYAPRIPRALAGAFQARVRQPAWRGGMVALVVFALAGAVWALASSTSPSRRPAAELPPPLPQGDSPTPATSGPMVPPTTERPPLVAPTGPQATGGNADGSGVDAGGDGIDAAGAGGDGAGAAGTGDTATPPSAIHSPATRPRTGRHRADRPGASRPGTGSPTPTSPLPAPSTSHARPAARHRAPATTQPSPTQPSPPRRQAPAARTPAAQPSSPQPSSQSPTLRRAPAAQSPTPQPSPTPSPRSPLPLPGGPAGSCAVPLPADLTLTGAPCDL